MSNYKNGKIYEIVCNKTNERYIGSTKRPINDRIKQHLELRYSSKQIIERNNFNVNILEHYPCNNKDELRKQEQLWMNKIDCINKLRAYRTEEDNIKLTKESVRQHYIKNKEHIKKTDKKRYEKKKEKIKEYERIKYHYRNSWGGDERIYNNLLKIDVNLFK